MPEDGPNGKVANGLVALSFAAILSVYAAGYVRTKPAADRFDLEAAARKRSPPPPRGAAVPAASKPTPATPAASEPAQATPAALERALATPAPSKPAPVKPAASAHSNPTPKAEVSPSPNAAPPPLPSPIEASSAAPASPPKSPAQPASAEGATVLPVQPTTAAFDETLEGDAVAASSAIPDGQHRDGTYTGWGSCRHGDVQVELVIQAGRIAWASIAKCYTRYPCSWIERLPPEVVGQQGPPISFVSGASESSDAFYYAVLDALSKAK